MEFLEVLSGLAFIVLGLLTVILAIVNGMSVPAVIAKSKDDAVRFIDEKQLAMLRYAESTENTIDDAIGKRINEAIDKAVQKYLNENPVAKG